MISPFAAGSLTAFTARAAEAPEANTGGSPCTLIAGYALAPLALPATRLAWGEAVGGRARGLGGGQQPSRDWSN